MNDRPTITPIDKTTAGRVGKQTGVQQTDKHAINIKKQKSDKNDFEKIYNHTKRNN